MRRFTASAEPIPVEPFEIAYRERVVTETDGGEQVVEWVDKVDVFHARCQIPSGILLRAAPALAGDVLMGMKMLTDLLRASVDPDEWGAFERLLDHRDVAVNVTMLADIAKWMVEIATDERPTSASSS